MKKVIFMLFLLFLIGCSNGENTELIESPPEFIGTIEKVDIDQHRILVNQLDSDQRFWFDVNNDKFKQLKTGQKIGVWFNNQYILNSRPPKAFAKRIVILSEDNEKH